MAFRNSSTKRNAFPFLRLALGFLLAGVWTCAGTPVPLYQNLSPSSYFSPSTLLNPPNSPPQIDALAFDNESVFSITIDTESLKVVLYETSDTLNFTNGDNAVMIATSGETGNFLQNDLADIPSYGVGFQFDDKTSSNRQAASVFYNSGIIRSESILDNDFSIGFGTLNILATNVYNPGNIELGIDSLLQITGNTVDLSRSVLDVESLEFTLDTELGGETLYNNVELTSVGAIGLDTNFDWNPGFDLTATEAFSSSPANLDLTNSESYFKIDFLDNSNAIVRAVFVQNESPNAPYNVYIQPLNSATAGDGTAYVVWGGYYTDPATGSLMTNYLYLQNDYVFGASTNVKIQPGPGNNGYPDNFTFYAGPTLLLSGPIGAGFQNVFADQAITNPYSYMSGQFIPSTYPTNTSLENPFGSVTNILGRIQISAGKELNLNDVVISGQNYLSIQCTNQFDGSAGSDIVSPYSDISLGVTNGDLEVTNLLVSDIPLWSGTVQAWSTRWTNVVNGITVDYRVMLVNSKLNPITQPWVQNLKLHTGTNLVISDDLSVYSSLYLDAQNLTVTTNGYGFGATSAQGELNALFPGVIGPVQWPNLRNVTNNGVLSGQGNIIFTNKTTYGAVINNGVISDNGTFISATNFLNSGTISNGLDGLSVIAQTITLTNGAIVAGGAVSLAGNRITASNSVMQCLSLTLTPANFITDFDVVGNVWVVGRTNATGGNGFSLLTEPANGDLLGTTITNICPPSNKLDKDIWSARDFGPSNLGFTNNAALGHLVLNVSGPSSLITFNGTGSSNALYVDALELQGTLTNGLYNNYNFTNWLALNTNITIYFAQAYIQGISVAEAIDQASVYSGQNGGVVSNGVVIKPGRLRWVPTYAGIFSSTNYVVNGVTNYYNAALAASHDIDSDGSGMANANNPSPFFTASQINFSLTETNQPKRAVLTWKTVPLATNSVFYTTSLVTNNWVLYTNFLSTSVPGSAYVTTVSDTNILKGTRFYKVLVQPWLTYPY